MRKPLATALLLAPLLASLPLRGQLESPLLSRVYPNIVNPGGKSLAMGGAFVSVADDPTAAFANPAGLPQMGSWQLGASGKGFSFEPRLTTANYLESPTAVFTQTSLDVYEPSASVNTLEFVSIAGPVGRHATLALYQAVNLRYQLDASDLVGGNYRTFYVNRGVSFSNSVDEQGGLDIQNQMYGASLGFDLGGLSVGGGVTLNRLRFDLTGGTAGGAHTFIINGDNGPTAPSTDQRLDTTVTSEVTSGTRIGWVAGFRLLVSEVGHVAIGGVYRRSPDFDVSYTFRARSPYNSSVKVDFSCGVDDPNVPGSGASACGGFDVPDDYSIGISAVPFGSLLLAVEVQRILYSQLNNAFVPIFAYSGCTAANPTCTTRTRTIPWGSSRDGTLARFGAEYTLDLSSGLQLSLRGGYYREPAHGNELSLYEDANRDRRPDDPSRPTDLVNPPFSAALATSYNGGEAEDHFSGGLGLTLGRRFAFDLAADVGKTTRQLVVSAFYRF